MPNITLYHGDNRVWLRRLIDAGVKVHSVVTDPPYGLVSIQKRFGKEDSKNARTEGNDGSFARLSGGFMGKAWDATGIERDPEFWKLVFEILLPGGYIFAFSGSRTGHWQACAMETAGFVMHPMHGWVFGSGFPKAHNAARAVDRAMGVTREVIVTPEAAEWEGWAYGTQAQKPALEPIYLAQKPFDCKTGAANLLKHGVGAVNIDGCRVPTDEVITNHSRGAESAISKGKYGDSKAQETHQTAGQALGRHPANLILDGSPDVVAMFPDSKGQQGAVRGDSGSAARFFHQFGPDADPLFYHHKAGKLDRAGSKHPTVKPVNLMRYLVRHITPPGGIVLDPFAGSGTTGDAAALEGFDCVLMEADPDYSGFLARRFGITTDAQKAFMPTYRGTGTA